MNKLILAVCLMLCPVAGFCSYRAEAKEILTNRVHEGANGNYAKCLLLIDLINNPAEKNQRNQYKATLKFEILYLIDQIESNIEVSENDLFYQQDMLAKAETTYYIDYWQSKIRENEHGIKQYRDVQTEISAFLKYTD